MEAAQRGGYSGSPEREQLRREEDQCEAFDAWVSSILTHSCYRYPERSEEALRFYQQEIGLAIKALNRLSEESAQEFPRFRALVRGLSRKSESLGRDEEVQHSGCDCNREGVPAREAVDCAAPESWDLQDIGNACLSEVL